SREAALRAGAHDFGRIYRDLVTGVLDPSLSPEPTLHDAEQLLGLMVFFAERSSARAGTAPAAPSAVSARAWGYIAPAGRRLLGVFPELRPLAHRAKRWLRLH
ncbi:MAG: hypothetical protein QM622_06485, partial [Microbacterium sp.]